MCQERANEQRVWTDVGIDRQDPFGRCGGMLQTDPQAVRLSVHAVRNRSGIDQANARVALFPTLDERAGAIARTAVDDQDLDDLVALPGETGQAWFEPTSLVQRRHEYRKPV